MQGVLRNSEADKGFRLYSEYYDDGWDSENEKVTNVGVLSELSEEERAAAVDEGTSHALTAFRRLRLPWASRVVLERGGRLLRRRSDRFYGKSPKSVSSDVPQSLGALLGMLDKQGLIELAFFWVSALSALPASAGISLPQHSHARFAVCPSSCRAIASCGSRSPVEMRDPLSHVDWDEAISLLTNAVAIEHFVVLHVQLSGIYSSVTCMPNGRSGGSILFDFPSNDVNLPRKCKISYRRVIRRSRYDDIQGSGNHP